MLLENGLKASRIGLTAQESQYLESSPIPDSRHCPHLPHTGRAAWYSAGQDRDVCQRRAIFPVLRQVHARSVVPSYSSRLFTRDLLAPSETGNTLSNMTWTRSRGRTCKRATRPMPAASMRAFSPATKPAMENLPTLPGLDTPLSPVNMAAGDGQISPAQGAGAKRLAHQLATNAVGHERKLLADGKSPADVYGKLLPSATWRAKTGLSAVRCAEYCQTRLSQPDGDGVEMLTQFLIAG